MECSLSTDYAQILVRGFLLTMVSSGGMLCIYLGWCLYKQAIVSKTTGTVEVSSFKLRFSAGSPGVVLAAFGAYLLFSVAQHRFESETAAPAMAGAAAYWHQPLPACSPSETGSPRAVRQGDFPVDGSRILLAQSTQPSTTAERKPQDSYTCAYWKRKTVFATGEGQVDAKNLQARVNSAIAVVDSAPETSTAVRRSKQEALLLLAELRQLAIESIEAESHGVGR